MNKEIVSLREKIADLNDKIYPLRREVLVLEEQLEKLVDVEEKKILEAHKDIVEKLESAGAEYIFVDFNEDESEIKVVEDDGTLHVNFGKVRGCFICNQDLRKGEWMKEARVVMKALGLKMSLLK